MSKTISHLFFWFIFLVFLSACESLTSPRDYTLTLNVEPSEAGLITQDVESVRNTEVHELTAVPNEHWVFTGWAGDLSGSSERAVLFMDSDKTVTALFQKREYPLTITIEGEGAVREEILPAKTTVSDYPHATWVRLTAEPIPGWEFIEWRGAVEGNETPIDIEIGGPVDVTAVFGRIDYKLIVTIEGSGEVEQEVIQSKISETEYPFETLVQLTAIPNRGWEFVGWSGLVEDTDSVITVNMSGQQEITATFERIIYNLNIDITGEGSVQKRVNNSVTTANRFPFETEVELISQPATGWQIDEWIVNGESSGSEPNLTITIEEDMAIEVRYKIIEYEVSVTVEGLGSFQRIVDGIPTSDTSYRFGTILRLEALPQTNWSFAGWSGSIQSTIQTIDIFVDQDLELNLRFLPFVPNSRILMLGDSITNGFPFTYRYNFYNLLTAAGLRFQFVGTQSSNPANYPGNWNTTHESYDGASTTYINNNLTGWLTQYTADIALIYLGTNDILTFGAANQPVASLNASLNNMTDIIDKLRTSNPTVKIYIAKIMPVSSPNISAQLAQDMVATWNQNMEALVINRNTAQSPVRIVDMNTGFTLEDLYDGVHPVSSAAQRMGQRWFQALTSL